MFHFQDVFLLAFTEIAADSEGRQHFEPKLQHFKLKIHHHLCFFQSPCDWNNWIISVYVWKSPFFSEENIHQKYCAWPWHIIKYSLIGTARKGCPNSRQQASRVADTVVSVIPLSNEHHSKPLDELLSVFAIRSDSQGFQMARSDQINTSFLHEPDSPSPQGMPRQRGPRGCCWEPSSMAAAGRANQNTAPQAPAHWFCSGRQSLTLRCHDEWLKVAGSPPESRSSQEWGQR